MDQNPETTLDITQAMADELTDYLMGDKLYRQVMVQTPDGFKQPKMTIGALLENLQDLAWQRDALNDEQQAALDGIVEQVNIGRNAFSDSWEALLRRELKALLDSWRWYLDDVSRDEAARENYARESRVRTRIDLVQRALADDPQTADERKELGELDTRLKGMMQPGDYVGPAGEQAHYPRRDAWWLYGTPEEGDG
ncbi:MAG: hypothetical protein KDI55_20150 [Anaerolineae bacterium]|nr:hypothetical protein [Anaerolineae bacterium]